MLQVVLVNPQIPPNTGNVIRLCSNTGAGLHLIGPLGFPLHDSKLKRAGLDYHEYARMQVHTDFEAFLAWRATQFDTPSRLIALTTKGTENFYSLQLQANDFLIFGSETAGLPNEVRQQMDVLARLPMRPAQRSMNLSNSVAVAVFEGWRQLQFSGADMGSDEYTHGQ